MHIIYYFVTRSKRFWKICYTFVRIACQLGASHLDTGPQTEVAVGEIVDGGGAGTFPVLLAIQRAETAFAASAFSFIWEFCFTADGIGFDWQNVLPIQNLEITVFKGFFWKKVRIFP